MCLGVPLERAALDMGVSTTAATSCWRAAGVMKVLHRQNAPAPTVWPNPVIRPGPAWAVVSSSSCTWRSIAAWSSLGALQCGLVDYPFAGRCPHVKKGALSAPTYLRHKVLLLMDVPLLLTFPRKRQRRHDQHSQIAGVATVQLVSLSGH